MTPEQVAEALRYQDHFLAALGVRFGVPMEEVREALNSQRASLPAADTLQSLAADGEGATALPVTPSPETADDAGGFDSRSLTEIEVKRGFESRPDASASMGGSTGMERSDGGERTAAEGAVVPSALVSPERVSEEVVPVAPAPRAGTVASRVAALHRMHPEYTARQAAAELGITKGSLAGTSHGLKIKWRKEAEAAADRQFKAEAELREHYAGVGKRLGKP